MVEQWDTEEFAALAGGNVPVENIGRRVACSAGAHQDVVPHGRLPRPRPRRRLLRRPANAADEGEYFREPGLTEAEARALLLPDTALPGELTIDEEREACRSLKGSMLRQEVYADDAGRGATPTQIQRARTPYTVIEQNFTIRTVQPRAGNRHAVFFTHAREAISYHYERNPADPRIQHALTLEVDGSGNVLKQATIGYGRREQIRVVDDQGNVQQVPNPGLTGLEATDQAKQTTPLLTYTENHVTNAIASPDTHRTPLPCETLTFELTGYTPTGDAGRFQASDLVEPDPAAAGRLRHKFTEQVPYEAAATGNPLPPPHRVAAHALPARRSERTRRRSASCTRSACPAKATSSPSRPDCSPRSSSVPHWSARRAPAARPGSRARRTGRRSTAAICKARHSRPTAASPRATPTTTGGSPPGKSFFTTDPADTAATELAQARQHFFLPRRYRDPFGQDAFVDFDANDLLMVETRDALGNRVTVDANDYRVLQPRLVSDPNRNQTEVAFDTLGMVVGTAVMGKPLPAPVEGDSLSRLRHRPHASAARRLLRRGRSARQCPGVC